MIISDMKSSAKGAFKGAVLTAIGAAIVYIIIKSWEGNNWWPW